MINKGTKIIKVYNGIANTKTNGIEGNMILGGPASKYNFPKPSRRPWSIQKDGDLWENVAEGVGLRGPDSIDITKVQAT